MNEEFLNNHKKSLREILPKAGGRSYKRSAPMPMAEKVSGDDNLQVHQAAPDEPAAYIRSRRMPKMPKYIIWGIGIVFILLVIFVGGSFFTQATAYVSPRQAKVTLDETVTASQSAGENELEYGTVSNKVTEKVTVPSAGSREVSESATGKITIYNDYGREPQTLIARTRFESKDGKIFRIAQAVTVPGQKTEGGKLVPGTATVTVTADEPGEEYNIGPAEFSIPGFADTDRFGKIYARSTEAFSGGQVGTVQVISDSDREDAEAELKSKLAAKGKGEASVQVPAGHILFKDAAYTTTTFDTEPAGDDSEVVLVGTLSNTAIVFNEERLAAYLASRYVPDYNGEPVSIANSKDLTIKLAEPDTDLAAATEVEFTISGTAHLVWKLDEEAFKRAVSGYNRSNFEMAIGDFPAIDSARLKIVPPWVRTIPDDPAKIKVESVVGE